jgi:hypothetical protein
MWHFTESPIGPSTTCIVDSAALARGREGVENGGNNDAVGAATAAFAREFIQNRKWIDEMEETGNRVWVLPIEQHLRMPDRVTGIVHRTERNEKQETMRASGRRAVGPPTLLYGQGLRFECALPLKSLYATVDIIEKVGIYRPFEGD